MRRIKVPILTEEYSIWVYLGEREEIVKGASKYLDRPIDEVDEFFKGRGAAVNCLDEGNPPLIIVRTDLDVYTAFATLAHEASHAMDYIQAFLGIEDRSGEVHAHGIASVMRHTLKDLHKLLQNRRRVQCNR